MITATTELARPPITPPPIVPSLCDPSTVDLCFWKECLQIDDEQSIKTKLYQVALQAYELYPYPCIRSFTFVNLICSTHFSYLTVLRDCKDKLYLDLGCFFGIDVRKLVLDGYPAQNVYGADLRSDYISIGSTLFDATFPQGKLINYLIGDIFDPSFLSISSTDSDAHKYQTLTPFKGHFTYIFAGALFHLFDQETQTALAVRLVSLWSKTSGAIIYGRHSIRPDGVEGYIDDALGRKRYGHSRDSWERMWKDIYPKVKVTCQRSREGDGKGKYLFWEVKVI